MKSLTRNEIFPENDLPAAQELIEEGRALAKKIGVGKSVFLSHYRVNSESEYKQQQIHDKMIMLHAQIGYRSLEKSRKAFSQIYSSLATAGYRIDRYGICLDWSMGYPRAQRAGMPKGTGLILETDEDFIRLTQEAPVAAHFGDFVIGTPAALENTIAALRAGSTSIGNLGQYFTFRMPHWTDDVYTTAETIKALALCAAQPIEILLHSNLDDGFASVFTDLACAIGAVMIEKTIVDDLIGGHVSHCYGHTFSDPLTRLAFQRALARVTETPGSMIYGNTTIYIESEIENFANLGSYLLIDIIAQRLNPTGHGLNPVPVTEAIHIPEIEEIVEAHLFANRLIYRSTGYEKLIDLKPVDEIADSLVEGGSQFKQRVFQGLEDAAVDVSSPFELLLAIRRVGARRLEELFGPGKSDPDQIHHRHPIVKATTINALENIADQALLSIPANDKALLRKKSWLACLTCTDVHEYGKLLVETMLRRIGIRVFDAGVSADPDHVARSAKEVGANFIAVSTYNGVALDYLESLNREMKKINLSLPIFIGGKLNQIPLKSKDSMPIDVSGDLFQYGAFVCHRVEDMLTELIRMAKE